MCSKGQTAACLLKCRVYVNLETKEKIYTSGDHMCPMDGYVCFRNSQLMCGRLGKVTLGGGNKAGLFQVVPSTKHIHPDKESLY